MPGSRLNTKNRVSLKTSVLTIVIHTAVAVCPYSSASNIRHQVLLRPEDVGRCGRLWRSGPRPLVFGISQPNERSEAFALAGGAAARLCFRVCICVGICVRRTRPGIPGMSSKAMHEYNAAQVRHKCRDERNEREQGSYFRAARSLLALSGLESNVKPSRLIFTMLYRCSWARHGSNDNVMFDQVRST